MTADEYKDEYVDDSDKRTIVAIDSQKLSMFQLCECKYDYIFNKRYVPFAQAAGMERGSIIHEGLEVFYNSLAEGIQPSVDKCIDRMERVAINMSLPIDDVREAIDVFRDYVEFYGDEPQYEIMQVEQVGSKLLYEDKDLIILYETKIDVISRLKHGDHILPWDTKTYSRRGPINRLSNQFIGYCWLLDVRNLVVNRVGFQKTVKPKDKFIREILSYPATLIEDWRLNTVGYVKRMLADSAAAKYPMNFTSCDKFNTECIFTFLCLAPSETRAHKAAQLFNIGKDWDVGRSL